MAGMSRFETLKGRRLGLAAIVLAGVCVFLPAIRSPLFLDDYLHVAMVEGTFPAPRGPLDLYDFVDDGNRAALTAQGLVPWWAHPQLTIRFFRPLSSALLWGLHRLTGHHSLAMHLCSLMWWLAAVLVVRSLYRRFFSERAAFLATAIFALSPCHALPLSWLANSEALVALVFGAFALDRQLRFRERPSLAEGALATLGFTLALLGGGEYALAFGGYVLAIELVRRAPLGSEPRSLFDHARGIVPFALPAAAYLVVRSALRYRAVGSGFYTDPLTDPVGFLRAVPYRLVALLADSWLTMGSHAWAVGWNRWALGGVVLAVAVALLLVLRRTYAALEPPARTTAQVLVWGSLFALAPTLAVVPAFRLLGVGMIGVAATSALVLDHAWFAPDAASDRSRGAALGTAVAILLGFTQLVHGPATAFLAARAHRQDGKAFAVRAAWMRKNVGAMPGADVGIVRAIAGTFFAPFALDARGRTPAHWRVLSHCGHVLVLRVDPRTIELIVPDDRSVYPMGELNLYRDPRVMMHVGDVVRAPGFTVTILEIGSIGGPRRVRIVFDEIPETTTRWIVENISSPETAPLPAVGQGTPFDL